MSDLSRYLAVAKADRSIDDVAKPATEAGQRISRSAVAKYLRGEHAANSPEETLLGLAAGFGLDVREFRRLVGRPPGELGPYPPTRLSNSLTQEQKDALDNLIRAVLTEGGPREDLENSPAEKIGR